MENFGSYIKAQREKKGIRLEEIASITKIHLHNLELLESGRWEQLPPEPFIRGFIIAYAKYIGLDTKEVIARFIEETGQKEVTAENEAASTSPVAPMYTPSIPTPHAPPESQQAPSRLIENRNPILNKRLLFGVGAAAVAGIAVVVTYIGKNRNAANETPVATTSPESSGAAPATTAPGTNPAGSATTEPLTTAPSTTAQKTPETGTAAIAQTPTTLPTVTPSVPLVMIPEAKKTEVVKTPTENRAPASPDKPDKTALTIPNPTPAAAAPADAPTGSAHEVTIEGKEKTWVKVVIDDEAPVEFFLPKGEKATYSAKAKIKVVLGNSTGSKVIHNGTEEGGTKFQGTIRSYIFPSEARFPQDKPAKRVTTSNGDEAKADAPKPEDESNATNN